MEGDNKRNDENMAIKITRAIISPISSSKTEHNGSGNVGAVNNYYLVVENVLNECYDSNLYA